MSKNNKNKSWNDKLHQERIHHLKRLDSRFADIPEESMMLVATPKIIDDYVRKIPRGEHRSLHDIRKDLAIKYGAEYTCPVTTSMYLRIVAEAAYENSLQGIKLSEITPIWRVLEKNSPIVKKLTFDYEFIQERKDEEDGELETLPE